MTRRSIIPEDRFSTHVEKESDYKEFGWIDVAKIDRMIEHYF